jgi:hypothetical protein
MARLVVTSAPGRRRRSGTTRCSSNGRTARSAASERCCVRRPPAPGHSYFSSEIRSRRVCESLSLWRRPSRAERGRAPPASRARCARTRPTAGGRLRSDARAVAPSVPRPEAGVKRENLEVQYAAGANQRTNGCQHGYNDGHHRTEGYATATRTSRNRHVRAFW